VTFEGCAWLTLIVAHHRPKLERDQRILELRQAGMKQLLIAYKFGISRQRVSEILRVAAARAQLKRT
jgi:transcriptional regulator